MILFVFEIYKKLEVQGQKPEARSQKQFVNRILLHHSPFTIHYSLFIILISFFLFLSSHSYALAEENIKESLSDLNQLVSPANDSELQWGKNPFAPPSEDKIRIGATSTDLKGLRLSAIIYNEENPSAIISQQIVYIGDTIEGQKVVDIKKNYVILQSNEKSYKLELKGIITDPETIEWGP